jgi:hypothetical protein
MALSIKERVKYYVGDCDLRAQKPEDGKSGYDKPVLVTGDYSPSVHPGTMYPLDVYRLLSLSKTKRFFVNCGDATYTETKFPILIKVRKEGTHGVIANLDSRRHWGDVWKHEDPPWDQKRSEIFWRGADTSHGVRLDFVKRFIGTFDVGFSQYVQDAHSEPGYLREYLKGVAPIETFLKYKYLPVVDGNDKSSSLNWVLASNSVPLMPVPRYHSWLCEPFLVPGYHYVEVARDFSDLPEKLEWCRAHDEECQTITKNGQEFMKQFMDPQKEQVIEQILMSIVSHTNSSAIP